MTWLAIILLLYWTVTVYYFGMMSQLIIIKSKSNQVPVKLFFQMVYLAVLWPVFMIIDLFDAEVEE